MNDEVLNKHFLPEISGWYFRTLSKHDQADEPYADDLIRSLIKVIFYWFVFRDRREVFSFLRNGDAAAGSIGFEADIISISSLNDLLSILSSYYFTLTENTADALGPELLGTVFEKLLSSYHIADHQKRSKITARNRTGSFYTPQIIVSYMVNESLKSFLDHKDTENSSGSDDINALIDSVDRLKILDPACGSGAFLIEMIDRLTDLLRKADPDNKLWKEKQTKSACAERDVLKRKKLICEIENIFNIGPPDFARRYFLIKSHIYGVDIQPAAIDIAVCRFIISLYASGEDKKWCSESSLLNLFQMIRSGFASADALFDFDPERIFGIKNDFDIVIGNPPYIEFKKLPADEKEKLSRYKSAKGKYDIYVTFIERSLELLHENGIFCCIFPTTFMKKQFGQEIRKMIRRSFRIINIQDFADIQVFGAATSYTGVFLFRKESVTGRYFFQYHQYKNADRKIPASDFCQSLNENKPGSLKEIVTVSNEELSSGIWNFQSEKTKELLRKIYSGSKPLSEYAEAIFQGISSGKDEVFYINEETIRNYNIEKGILRKLLKGRDIKSYRINWSGSYVIYPYDECSKVFPEKYLMEKYPNAYLYLQQKRKLLEGRIYFDESNKKWYELWNHRNYNNFMKERIVTPEISSKNNFALTDSYFGNTKTYHIIPKEMGDDLKYFLLALLNSKLIDFVYKKITTPYAHGFYAYKTQFLNNIPVKTNENLHLIACIARKTDKIPLPSFMDQLNNLIYELYLPHPNREDFLTIINSGINDYHS